MLEPLPVFEAGASFHNLVLFVVGLQYMVTPDEIRFNKKSTVCVDVWAGSYYTAVLTDKVMKYFKSYK